MTRKTEIFFLAALLTMAVFPVAAAETAAPAKASATATTPTDEAAICEDDATKSAKAKEREAKLAELGRRLAAEPAAEGEFRVLNRTGHNYSVPAPTPMPPSKAAPAPDTKKP